jgi:carboxymethylenebutenolidase
MCLDPSQIRRWTRSVFLTCAGVSVLLVALGVACNHSSRASQPAPNLTPDERLAAAPPGRAETPTDNEPSRPIERASIVVGSKRLSLHLPAWSNPPLPSVLVFHSAIGRTDSVLEWCDALARAGFGAVALDFYDGKIAASPTDSKALRDSANSRAPELQRWVTLAYDSMQSDPRLRSQKRFLLGWSFGAAWATFASSFLSDVKGVIAYYGEGFRMNPSLYDKVSAPILFIGAQRDTEPTPAQLHDITGKLNSNGNMAELVLVDAMHGFAERRHDGYDPRAARESWEKVLHFLAMHQR